MRDLYIIGGISLTAVAIGVVLFLFGPSSLQSDVHGALQTAQAGGTQTLTFTTIAHGQVALSINDRTNYRIDSADDLQALWPLIYGQNAPAVPTINFSKYELLAVFDGSHSTNGYDIAVHSVTDANAIREVQITHLMPGTNCTTTSVATSPFQIIEVAKTPFALDHVDTTGTTSCQ